VRRLSPILLVVAALLAGCDTVAPDRPGTLVLEAFVETGAPLPPVRVSRTRSLTDTGPSPVTDASVVLTLGGRDIPYGPTGEPGTFRPTAGFDTVIARTGAAFRLVVRSGEDRAEATGSVPPALTGLGLDIVIPDEPVEAVLLDSLSIPLDSLQFELPARTGLVYPIVATLSWADAEADWWIALRVEPRDRFSSTLLDYFLRPSAVASESDLRDAASGSGRWSGVYAVPVESDDAPVPQHDLVVTLVRGDAAWAAYAASAGDPLRREPTSNVEGGVGIVTGVSVLRRTVPLP
jgi:hypothetical protein